MNRHEEIAKRAYQIWEAAGRPDGKAIEHWVQAEAELAGAASRGLAAVTEAASPSAEGRARRKTTPKHASAGR